MGEKSKVISPYELLIGIAQRRLAQVGASFHFGV